MQIISDLFGLNVNRYRRLHVTKYRVYEINDCLLLYMEIRNKKQDRLHWPESALCSAFCRCSWYLVTGESLNTYCQWVWMVLYTSVNVSDLAHLGLVNKLTYFDQTLASRKPILAKFCIMRRWVTLQFPEPCIGGSQLNRSVVCASPGDNHDRYNLSSSI